MTAEMSKSGLSTRDIVRVGMFAAFLAVMSQLSVPLPGGVPVTIQVFAVAVVGAALGSKLGALAVLVYILVGAVGMPVFANFRGGLEVLAGTSGGYIIGWPFMALLCGLSQKITLRPAGRKADVSRESTGRRRSIAAVVLSVIPALVGLAIVECLGGLWWSVIAGGNLREIMIYSLAAFIPKDIVITILGLFFGRQLRRLLNRVSGV